MRDFALAVPISRAGFNARQPPDASECETMALADLLTMADDEDRQRWEALRLGLHRSSWRRLAPADDRHRV